MKTTMSSTSIMVCASAAFLIAAQINMASSTVNAVDPGVRPSGPVPSAGGPITGLSTNQLEYFGAGQTDFAEAESVAEGLGPRMNLDSCAGCHAQPASGGSSPVVNPQIAFATLNGGTDSLPSFLSANGPVREVRFVNNPDGTPDGGVHALFTINGRLGADGCSIPQPDFARQVANHNVIFRIPTPVFGAGLEIWLTPRLGLLFDGQYLGLKGKDERDSGIDVLDDKLLTAQAGVTIRLR